MLSHLKKRRSGISLIEIMIGVALTSLVIGYYLHSQKKIERATMEDTKQVQAKGELERIADSLVYHIRRVDTPDTTEPIRVGTDEFRYRFNDTGNWEEIRIFYDRNSASSSRGLILSTQQISENAVEKILLEEVEEFRFLFITSDRIPVDFGNCSPSPCTEVSSGFYSVPDRRIINTVRFTITKGGFSVTRMISPPNLGVDPGIPWAE